MPNTLAELNDFAKGVSLALQVAQPLCEHNTYLVGRSLICDNYLINKRFLEPSRGSMELCGILGEGVNQAADFMSDAASIPSMNFTPLITFGN